MKTRSVTDVARNFRAVREDALSVFGDLYRTLDDDTADALSATIASHRKGRRGRLSELRDPWVG